MFSFFSKKKEPIKVTVLAADEGGFEIVNSPSNDIPTGSLYIDSGLYPKLPEGSDTQPPAVANPQNETNFHHLQNVPFKLSKIFNTESNHEMLRFEMKEMLNKVKRSANWDHNYNFSIEQSVMNECQN